MANKTNKLTRGRLFLDIETSYNICRVWRCGYNLTVGPQDIIEERKIICVSWKWAHDPKTYNLKWDRNKCDKKLLEQLIPVMDAADEIVMHNGDRFDEKWIRTRCLYHGVKCEPKYKTLDTLKKAKAHFNFNSNKLDYILKFLGKDGKRETGGLQLWIDCIEKNDRKALAKMVHYCDGDVIKLEEVWNEIDPYVKHNTNFNVLKGGDIYDCPKCGSDGYCNKTKTTAAGAVKRQMQCHGCHSYYTISNAAYMKKLKDLGV